MSSLYSYLSNNLGRFALTIYADDIQISTDLESSHQIKELVIDMVLDLATRYGFAINHSKTRILYAKYGYRRILGINVGDTETRATRKTMKRIRAARHQGNHTSLGGLVTWSQNRLPRV
jgi:ribosomal protein L19E